MTQDNDIIRINCCKDGCGTFPMDRALFNRYKRTGEWWTCPAGHEQHFTDTTEQRLRKELEEKEKKIDRLEERLERYQDSAKDWWHKHNDEKQRARLLERLLFKHVVGVVEVGEDSYKWACECGSHGQKGFETPDEAREAWREHRNRAGCGNAVPEEVLTA